MSTSTENHSDAQHLLQYHTDVPVSRDARAKRIFCGIVAVMAWLFGSGWCFFAIWQLLFLERNGTQLMVSAFEVAMGVAVYGFAWRYTRRATEDS